MKEFIKKIFIFIFIPLFLGFIIFLIHKVKINNIKLDQSIHTLIIGDSHTQSGINDSILSHSLNISQSSEHYLYTYNVLKLILKNNPQINHVIMGVSFHSFSKYYDNNIQDEDKTSRMFPKYISILDMQSLGDLKDFQVKQIKGISKNIFKNLTNHSSIHEYSFIGDFYESDNSNINDSTVTNAIKRHYFTDSDAIQKYSDYQLKYLNKIIQLCEKKNVDLILINTPISKAYYNQIPKNFLSNYYSIIQNLDKKVSYYDFHSIDYPMEYWGDGDHLNAKGARNFTIFLRDSISLK